MAAALTGIAELLIKTTDQKSGITGQEASFFPRINAISTTRETETTTKQAFKPVDGTGLLVDIANYQTSETWNIELTLPASTWLDFQLIWGQVAATETVTYWLATEATIASNVITDVALNGLAVTAVNVTLPDYDATGGSPRQFEVVASPASPTASTVVFDNSANTLTFDAVYEGLVIWYSYETSASKSSLGKTSSPTQYGTLELFATINTSGQSTANGFMLHAPEIELDGALDLSVTGDDEITINALPVLKNGFNSAVAFYEL